MYYEKFFYKVCQQVSVVKVPWENSHSQSSASLSPLLKFDQVENWEFAKSEKWYFCEHKQGCSIFRTCTCIFMYFCGFTRVENFGLAKGDWGEGEVAADEEQVGNAQGGQQVVEHAVHLSGEK